ncbi:MAG: DUF1538 domain-containing protein [Defluviitaleaceae bacterium]|nr:DUF1538 domain-containing protein [Defluviitaleaceae bacterium]
MIFKNFKVKMREAVFAVAPVTLVIFLLGFTVVPMPVDALMLFLVGTGFVVVGLGVFTLGAEMAMAPMGESLGDYIVKKKNIAFMVFMGLISGFIITIAEPGLIVLAEQVPGIPSLTLIVTVAAGVGVFLAIAFLRMVLNVQFKYVLIVFYGLLFFLAIFVPGDFLPISFDSGGATTGSMTVPFIMALGVAVARSNGNGKSDSFGLIAICSIGPIIAVMILGLVYTPTGAVTMYLMDIPSYDYANMLLAEFLTMLPVYIWDVSISLAPIVFLFTVTKLFAMKLKIFAAKSWKVGLNQAIKICVGVICTFGGLVLFLAGANVGFLLMGNLLGERLALLDNTWWLIPIGMILGFLVITAEPAVQVLNKQVADITGGAVSRKAMGFSLALGVAFAIGLSMLRVVTHIHIIWVLLPGYLVAVGLSFFVPKKFTSIAFDAGGVASGPLTSAFLLPLAIGASTALGGNVAADAFGLIAMVALTPLIAIQVLGLHCNRKQKRKKQEDNVTN